MTTDAVLFTIREQRLQLLLIRRGRRPYLGGWALPGGFLNMNEDLTACAARELEEETGIRNVSLEQFHAFGSPGRDPRERVISIAFTALIPFAENQLRASSDAAEAAWHPLTSLPELAFDHTEIVRLAHDHLMRQLHQTPLLFCLDKASLTLSELQSNYELLSGQAVDPAEFEKWILMQPWIAHVKGGMEDNDRSARRYRARQAHEEGPGAAGPSRRSIP